MRAFLISLLLLGSAHAADPSQDLFDLNNLQVKIAPDLPYLTIEHNGKDVIVMRRQDEQHTIDPPFHLTSRPCPPFCVQPVQLAPGVETLGELELLDYMQRVSEGDNQILIIDSRTPDHTRSGTIPGSVNIPYTRLDPAQTPKAKIRELLEMEFDALYDEGLWDFSTAKTLVMFCNGAWCGQSPANIQTLLKLGYPPHKLKWYRGGIQAWEQFGLTTVQP